MKGKSKEIVIVSSSYPPLLGGSSTVVYNLAQNLLEKGYKVSIITQYPYRGFKKEKESSVKVYYLFSLSRILNRRLEQYVKSLSYIFNLLKVYFLIKKLSPKLVIGIYPSHLFLELAMKGAKMARKKFLPYLHDTLIEALTYTKYKKKAIALQNKLFYNYDIVVISEGMQELYKEKYNLQSTVLCHTLTEERFSISPKALPLDEIKNSIFWGGNIYNINKNAIKRISLAISETETELEISNLQTDRHLKAMGLSKLDYKKKYYSDSDYFTNLKKQGILLIALDFPDESPVHSDELKTIFPTKTIEYLLSDRPILVHAPENYFITKFFRTHQCGYVCTSRNIQEIANIIRTIHKDKMFPEVIANARKVAHEYFHPKDVVHKMQEKNIV